MCRFSCERSKHLHTDLLRRAALSREQTHKAKLRGSSQDCERENGMTLGSTLGNSCQGAVEQHPDPGLAAPLKLSCVTETRYYVAAVANLRA